MKKILTIMMIALYGMAISAPVQSMLGARNIATIGAAEKLPYDAQLEYAHFPSGAYIDTGMYICNAFGSSFSFRINKLVSSYDTYYGAYDGGKLIGLRRNGTSSNISSAGYVSSFITNIVTDTINSFEVNPEGRTYRWQYWNGDPVLYMTSTNYGMFPLTLFIGGAHHSSPSNYFATSDFDFFGFKLWDYRESPSLIMDLIPVRIGEEAFVFDKVSKQFFSSLGTAKLGLGPDVK